MNSQVDSYRPSVCVPALTMNLLVHLTLIYIILSPVSGGILKDIINYPKKSFSSPTTEPSATGKKPLHYDEQNYLEDTAENVIKAERVKQVESSSKTETAMTENNGVYEFDVGTKKCKFYVGSRQQMRTLKCNEKQCTISQDQSGWKCDNLMCTIQESKKTASCGSGRNFIDAPRRVSCKTGQVFANGACRETGF